MMARSSSAQEVSRAPTGEKANVELHIHQVLRDHEEPYVVWQCGIKDQGGSIHWKDYDRTTSESIGLVWQCKEEALWMSGRPHQIFHLFGYKFPPAIGASGSLRRVQCS